MSFLEMLVIGRMMRRDGKGKSRVLAAMPAGRKRLALHHRHLVLILMDSIVHNIVDSGFGAEIARFELFHKFFSRLRGP
jgi:hypothetical protein